MFLLFVKVCIVQYVLPFGHTIVTPLDCDVLYCAICMYVVAL